MSSEDLLEKRLAEMRDRLQHADSINREREHDLLALRKQVRVLMEAHRHGNEYVHGGDSNGILAVYVVLVIFAAFTYIYIYEV